MPPFKESAEPIISPGQIIRIQIVVDGLTNAFGFFGFQDKTLRNVGGVRFGAQASERSQPIWSTLIVVRGILRTRSDGCQFGSELFPCVQIPELFSQPIMKVCNTVGSWCPRRFAQLRLC